MPRSTTTSLYRAEAPPAVPSLCASEPVKADHAAPRANPSGARSGTIRQHPLRFAHLLRTAQYLAHCITDAIAPQCCVACQTSMTGGRGLLCDQCADTIRALRALPYCPHCARSMRPEAIHEHACARCVHENHWNVAAIVRVGPYESPLREITLGLKYAGLERCARLLADLLADSLRTAPWLDRVDAFVPIPIHPLRRLQRPCAHAAVLAAELARRLDRPVWHAVRRTRYAPSQMDLLSRANRFANVVGCFAARPAWLPQLWPLATWPPTPPALPRLAGRTVCIVDNVLTTGATLHEVSRVLRKAGAKRIYAAVISRATAAGDFQADTESLIDVVDALRGSARSESGAASG